MFPSLDLELSDAKGLILTVLIKPDCAFLCNSILGFWINYIVWIREENRVEKNGQLSFHCLSLLLKAACWLKQGEMFIAYQLTLYGEILYENEL